jgi:hypothetical protein
LLPFGWVIGQGSTAANVTLQGELAPERGGVRLLEAPVLGLEASHLCLEHRDLMLQPVRRRLRVGR